MVKTIIVTFDSILQVIYLKGDTTADMIVLDPRWLCGSVCGHLLSQEFLDTTKSTGCYTSHDFQLAAPEWHSDNLLPVLEALGMCTQVQLSKTYPKHQTRLVLVRYLVLETQIIKNGD